ncbi:2-oxoacid:ferredoxin oxidoreductase subunit alpha [Candidatus Nitrososphaera sp. FF02]|uniref:2-oxoacid:ferredoxin oxidoreductase subunit alpha n=1 Tax=Candidatus Nitrososphaera sp. FF02 TaxID=3398226 RepID=UPI0039ECDBC5
MTTNSLSWVIGGAQGSGVDSAANIFSRACAIGGLYIFGKREYYSNIKGEHSYFTVRVSERQIRSPVDNINVLVSFDAETVLRHFEEVTKGGAILYDSDILETKIDEVPTVDDYAAKRMKKTLEKAGLEPSVKGALEHAKRRGVLVYPMPYFHLLEEFAKKMNDPSLSKLARMINVMALSASMALLEFDGAALAKAIRFIFRAKPKIAEMNVQAAEYIYNYAKAKFAGENGFEYRLKAGHAEKGMTIAQGSQSSALGKMVAGCRFQTYYPITPASDDSEFLESNEVLDLYDSGKKGSTVVVQTEDEIAAITMAIGSALAGARSATATSGPGFSLMAEALGWAGINEVPLVVSLYQRAGPSTGLPTRHEQGDLNFAINAGHGEFPRIVFASGDIEESFYDTVKVFNLADRYQMPVIHMLDKAIANSVMTCRVFEPSRAMIDRGSLATKVTEEDKGVAGNYLRFKISENPVSARIALGTEDAIFWNTGDEHTEEGHITEDPELRVDMMDKRMNKLDLALKEIPDEDKAVLHGDANADVVILGWGSTKGAVLDAMEKLQAEGVKVKFVQLRLLNPFPAELVKKLLARAKTVIDVEMNYLAQLGGLVSQHAGRAPDYNIVKYNGRPMSLDEVYSAVKRIMSGNAPRRQVLKGGS